MANQYKYGTDKEQKVARSLRSSGAKVNVSKGSRGSADIKATFKTGTKWNVQVKATRSGKPSQPSAHDLGRLKQSSTKSQATPVVANVTPGGIQYKSARSGRTLKPSTKRN
ncbi:MAG: hypothetical protein HWN69_00900 [Desulfobacterales bacterium]|nr:hypothetical protein [Desulfobacterales bacterium]